MNIPTAEKPRSVLAAEAIDASDYYDVSTMQSVIASVYQGLEDELAQVRKQFEHVGVAEIALRRGVELLESRLAAVEAKARELMELAVSKYWVESDYDELYAASAELRKVLDNGGGNHETR